VTRRQQILETAGDLFRRQGYHATSMREIARNVRLQGSSLYAHIHSKEELLAAIVEEAADAFVAAAGGVDRTLPPRERLRQLARAHLQVMCDELPHATVFFHEWSHLPQPLRSELVQRRDAYQAHFSEVVRAGVADGSFTVEDPALATLFVLSALNWTYQWLDPHGRLDLDALAQRYADMLLLGLGDASTAAPSGSGHGG